MKKTLLAVVMGIVMIALAACGGNGGSKHSDAYNQAEKLIKNSIEEIEAAADCDAVDNALFSAAFGLMLIPDIDKLAEEENKDFEALSEKFSKTVDDKKAALGCEEEDWGGDDAYDTDSEVFE